MKLKKILATLIASSLIISSFAACSTDTAEEGSASTGGESSQAESTESEEGGAETSAVFNATGMPIVNETVTYNLMCIAGGGAASVVPMAEKQVILEYEALTGVHIEWEEVVDSAFTEKMNLVLNSNDYPDGVFNAGMDMAKALGADLLLAYDDYLEYAPNLEQMWIDVPQTEQSSRYTEDGKHYTYNGVHPKEFSALEQAMFINTDWLSQVGMDAPTTTDELYEVLVAFKNAGDLNGNGMDDEIPAGFSTYWNGFDIEQLFGAWDVMSFRGPDKFAKFTIRDGQLDLNASNEDWRAALEYFNKLYSEGLTEAELMTMEKTTQRAKAVSPDAVYGIMVDWNKEYITNENTVDQYELLLPLAGPDGDQMYARNSETVGVTAGLTIFNTAENPEILVRWIDHMSDPTWAFNAKFGMEGELWSLTDEGVVLDNSNVGVTTEEYRQNEGISLNPPGNRSPVTHGFGEVLSEADQLKQEWSDLYEPYMYPVDAVWPKIPITPETAESKDVNLLKTDLSAHIQAFMVNAVLNGVTDEEWEAHLSQLELLEADTVVSYWQGQYDSAMGK